MSTWVPPPTINDLAAGPEDPIHLLPSTRKLADIPGTTPRFAECLALSDPEYASESLQSGRRQEITSLHSESSESLVTLDSIDSHSSNTGSWTSTPDVSLKVVEGELTPQGNGTSRPLPKALGVVLSLKPVSAIYSPRASIISTAQPASPPLSPTFVMDTPDVRRKRMAKLIRTLGENIPPELVFHSEPAPPSSIEKRTAETHKESKAQRGRSFNSDLDPNSSFLEISDRARSRRSTTAFATLSLMHNGVSEGVEIPHRAESTGSRLKRRLTTSWVLRSPSRRSIRESKHRPVRPREHPEGCVTRKEHEWSGEWNQMAMDDVVKGLRGLKGR